MRSQDILDRDLFDLKAVLFRERELRP